ncbi:coiled-coil domain-containing protein 153-like [Saccostrea echinata]|uniref:coiled-coil domain-containing protein 153-like n=1 Tax=Saccostrea echinata TaxID=191078 RepID=UPI002A7EC209|nr:coiled-coil domain-containing protein 153-like [Saccostrea echinata]
MPPKKKKGKGKGKKKKKDDAQLALDDQYTQTMNKIEALKDHLAVRKELARRNQAAEESMKAQMDETKGELEEVKKNQLDITAAMTTQYKTMQTKKNYTIHQLERELTQTTKQLKETERKLKETEDERDRIIKEKDEEIAELNHGMQALEHSYKRILDDAMRKFMEKLESAKEKWEETATLIQTRNKQTLMELQMTDPWTFDEVKPMRALHF